MPSSAVKITRNISGNANVKNAEAGLRQNALFDVADLRSVKGDGAHRGASDAGVGPARPVSSR